jgi:hypothetical protein
MYDVLSRHDAKHYGDVQGVVCGNKTLTNNMFESGLLGGFRMGGLFGLDGMHPTVVGYGLMARAIMAAMGEDESRIDLADLCLRDTLIQTATGLWTTLMYIWRDIRKAETPTQIAAADHSGGKSVLLRMAGAAASGANGE